MDVRSLSWYFLFQKLTRLQERPDLFQDRNHHYTLKDYHAAGSLILSRSFSIGELGGSKDEAGEGDDDDDGMMDVDEPYSATQGKEDRMGVDNDSDDEQGNEDEIAMVPLADMFNARYGSENVSLTIVSLFKLRIY
jgi:SET domain-containing protein 6